jgi:hypothetical protein
MTKAAIKQKNNGKNNGEAQKPKNKGWANLKPMKPGETRNPKGRPKGKLNYDTRVDMAIEMLALKFAEDQNKKNAKVKGYVPITADDVDIEGDIFMQHINKARGGDRHFIDSFLDRRHGKAKQPVELTGKDGNPIEYQEKITAAQSKLKMFQDKWFKK